MFRDQTALISFFDETGFNALDGVGVDIEKTNIDVDDHGISGCVYVYATKSKEGSFETIESYFSAYNVDIERVFFSKGSEYIILYLHMFKPRRKING